jgi:hypothetical protein
MALLTDDQDIRKVNLFMEFGGNGDYYLNLMEKDKLVYNKEGNLVKTNILINMRVSISGGNAPLDVQSAIVNLYKALKLHNLNEHPLNEK